MSEKKMWYTKCQISAEVRKSQNTGKLCFARVLGMGVSVDLLMSSYTHFGGCIKIADGNRCWVSVTSEDKPMWQAGLPWMMDEDNEGVFPLTSTDSISLGKENHAKNHRGTDEEPLVWVSCDPLPSSVCIKCLVDGSGLSIFCLEEDERQ